MSKDWQLVLNESSVLFLLACKARQRNELVKELQSLAGNPDDARGDFEARDSTGRPVQIKIVGHFLVSFWKDNFVKELRIIRLEHV